jgi:hypothetical protein
MIEPVQFGFNEETAASNFFSNHSQDLKPGEIASRALEEFKAMVDRLRSEGVDVWVVSVPRMKRASSFFTR